MKIIVLLLSAILLISNVAPAYSQEYDDLRMTWFYKTPLVCTMEALTDKIMDDTRLAVQEWEGKMKATEKFPKDREVWNIDYRLVTDSEFDMSQCDITISFYDKPANPEDLLDILGYTFYDDNTIEIEIYYEDVEICRSQDSRFIYYDLCYSGRVIPSSELQTTVKHELGHALGLGHYTTFNQNRHESIMTPYEFENPRLQIITTSDVEALLSLYGDNGFVNEWTNPNLLWPLWLADSLFEWYRDATISDKEYYNAMNWYHSEIKISFLDTP